MQVTVNGSYVENVTFHDAATAVGLGTPFPVGTFKTLTVEIYGTSVSRTVTFKAKCGSGVDRTLMGVRLSDLSTATSSTGTGEIWQFDVTGLDSVTLDLTAVSGGNVYVKGKAVA